MVWKKILLGAIAYFVSSFVVNGVLGFMVEGDYFLNISIMRQEPIAYLCLPSTFLVGIAVSILYPITLLSGTLVIRGLKFGLLIGFIIIPTLALDIPGRFIIPSEGKWIVSQSILGMIHSCIAGILMGLVYKNE